jgi:hypothetical protein
MKAISKGTTVATKLMVLVAFLGSGCLMTVSDQLVATSSTTTGGIVVTGGPQVSCVPTVGIFAPTADGTSTMVKIYCSNVGSAASGVNLMIAITGTDSSVFTAQFDEAFPPTGLSPNQSVAIDVTYTPADISRDEGMLTLKTNGGNVSIPLYALGINSSCRLMIPTSALDFGHVVVGSTSTALSFAVDNVGTTDCELAGPLLIAEDPSNSFHIVSTSFQPDMQLGAYIISASASDPTSRLIVDVSFTPTATGQLSGEVSDLVGLSGFGVAASP